MTFTIFKLREEVLKALEDIQITQPTDIQKKAIPLIMQGKDVVGISKTGSGKTLAFGVPLIEKVQRGKGIQLLVLAPTRELAVQIAQELKKVSKYLHLTIATIYGGVSLSPQLELLKKADIVVGTPGRIIDHLERKTILLSNLQYVVLDEADKMVDMGFIDDIKKILSYTPKKKQMLLFGATISHEIEDIKKSHMNEPVIAKAQIQVEQEVLEQYYVNVQAKEKFSVLIHLLNQETKKKTIVFCSTRNTVELVSANLERYGIRNEKIHGKLTQNQRLHVIELFNKGKIDLLVASAVAARGLDIKEVSHVINYDLSQNPEEYIHRIGRTARAGEKGKAITLLSPKDHEAFQMILNRYHIDVKPMQIEGYKHVGFATQQQTPRKNQGYQQQRKEQPQQKTYAQQFNNNDNKESLYFRKRMTDSQHQQNKNHLWQQKKPGISQKRDYKRERRPAFGQRR